MRITERMAHEHRSDSNSQVYVRLSQLEAVPHKEKSFVNYVSGYCHISEEEAKKLWDELCNWEKEILKEKRAYRGDRVFGLRCESLIEISE